MLTSVTPPSGGMAVFGEGTPHLTHKILLGRVCKYLLICRIYARIALCRLKTPSSLLPNWSRMMKGRRLREHSHVVLDELLDLVAGVLVLAVFH